MKLHITNIDFEDELSGQSQTHPNYTYLRSLPLLYMNEGDTLDPNDPYTEVSYWGYTHTVQTYLNRVGQKGPPLAVVKELSSKLFTFDPNRAILLKEKNDLSSLPFENPLLKSLHGFSGRGHCAHSRHFLSFCKGQWDKGFPVICEPMHTRLHDFSTQWYIDEDGTIHHLGTLHLHNGKLGGFRSISTKTPKEFPMQESRAYVEKAAQLGFFGNLGVDAYIIGNGTPIVSEVNPRKTLGYVALEIAKKRKSHITLSFGSKGNTQLPQIPGAKEMTVIEHI